MEPGSEKGEETVDAETKSVLSENTSETASHWKPADASISEFRFMMEETEFNIKMVEIKQDVSLFRICLLHGFEISRGLFQ